MKKILGLLMVCACLLDGPVYAAYEATGKAEDTAEADAMILVPAGSVRRDTAASSAGTTGDHATLNTDATGRLWSNTEMPDAAALADNTANPTVPGVAAFLMCYDGSTWDRCQGGLTDTDDGTIAGSQVPSLGASLAYTYDGTNWTRLGNFTATEDAAETVAMPLAMVGCVRRDTAASSSGTTGDNSTCNVDATGRLWTHVGAIDAGTAVIGKVGIDQTTPGTTNLVQVTDGSGALNVIVDSGAVSPSAATSGGCTVSSVLSAASVNETEVKATAGQVYWIHATNVSAAVAYLKFYNDTAANIDETDTPVLRFAIPGATTGGGFTTSFPVGAVFSTAIVYRTTTAVADNSTAAVGANELLINVCYK